MENNVESHNTFVRINMWDGWDKIRSVYETQRPGEWTEELRIETSRFLTLKVISEDTECNLSPSIAIDGVWHVALSMPKLYINLCYTASKKPMIIDHDPAHAFDDEEIKQSRYNHTCNLYEETFGESPFSRGWPKPESEKIKVLLKTIMGTTISIKVSPDATVEEFKDIIANRLECPPCNIRLIYAGKQLMDYETLANHRIREMSTVHQVLRLSGC